MGLSYPSGVGAGVVCSFASFAASDSAVFDFSVDRDLRSRNSVTRKDMLGCDWNLP